MIFEGLESNSFYNHFALTIHLETERFLLRDLLDYDMKYLYIGAINSQKFIG